MPEVERRQQNITSEATIRCCGDICGIIKGMHVDIVLGKFAMISVKEATRNKANILDTSKNCPIIMLQLLR